ncbi:tRNA (adenosine(37)-N6)-threonylcarbamoyltransferase complex dimerization subunit type 1 TsaB [Chlorobium sp. N1]|uniref:tRNA (adenosine(37)-N6)-threonylcarbamoyltransferase complex dimerization subunit type 1 TsaB n=1 Tax=Chlorobium sp. N1 TaxID=2491138 RepID=UPI00103E7895|nr:tRNA (adenosine(37)-N6)-threonylcarbamoyltransferase complex dimerization subunit type 1 TsaB [Chlorobium sp. N1]TCD48282.1 tRNA (adenosine(37)-N6)-threonylcarbamoyltransferase complex dimerization subunit type 1 TsaB [Chlorobium sp. N1]
MNILAIECTHGVLSLALYRDGFVTEARGESWQKTAEGIVPLIDRLMKNDGAEPGSLDAVAISSGPGSFTALRIGMSVAKGIASALAIPVVPVPTLPAMAAAMPAACGAERVMAVVEARKGEYYHAVYSSPDLAAFRWEGEVRLGRRDAVIDALAGRPRATAVTGRRLDPLREALLEAGATLDDASGFTAASILPMALRLLEAGRGVDAGLALADYHQEFVSGGAGVRSREVGGK